MKSVEAKMASQVARKCFTFTWILENISCHWDEKYAVVKSPTIVVDLPNELKFHINFCPRGFKDDDYVDFYFYREGDNYDKIDIELAILSKDGLALVSTKQRKCGGMVYFGNLEVIKKIFDADRSVYLSDNNLRVRCRIWKSEGGFAEDVQWFARTRVCIKKEIFLWNIPNISRLQSGEKCTYQLKSELDNEVFMSFNFLPKNPDPNEDSFAIQLVSENSKKKYFELHLSILNGLGKVGKELKQQFYFTELEKEKMLHLPFSKQDVLENKKECLLTDNLSIRCECIYSTGSLFEEIQSIVHNCDNFGTSAPDAEVHTLSASKRVLNENLKSLFQDNILSDVKLQTSTETFLAHKNILSARSPVFKAMFENDMKEKITKSVEIEDLDSDTVSRMLQYIYTAEIKDLQWENACQLYRAADKYEILSLRDECSAYLKGNVSISNACETLIFADTHQDEDLKTSVQDFIFDHGIINSDKWKPLMETNVKLAANTMYLQIRKTASDCLSGIEVPTSKADVSATPSPFSHSLASISNLSFGVSSNSSMSLIDGPATVSTLKSSVPRPRAPRRIATALSSPVSNFNNLATPSPFGVPAALPEFKFGSDIQATPTFTFGFLGVDRKEEPKENIK